MLYKDYLLTLDDETLSEKFDITYELNNENESESTAPRRPSNFGMY